jgi:hypothetical protein
LQYNLGGRDESRRHKVRGPIQGARTETGRVG